MAERRTYQVTSSTLESSHNFGDGQMNKFVVSLADVETGQVYANVESWRAVGKDPILEGDQWTGEITSTKNGLKLKSPRRADEPQPSSNGPAPSSGGSRQDATGRSIERQVALKAAAEVSSAYIQAGKHVTPESIGRLAEQFDAFLKAEQAPAPAPVQEQQPAPILVAPGAPVSDDDDIPF